jgi:hypothetical protein
MLAIWLGEGYILANEHRISLDFRPMNKIIINHYPVAKLPRDMRQGLNSDAAVKIIIEQEQDAPQIKRMTAAETIAMLDKKPSDKPPTEAEWDEAVSRVRALRDEWEDE